MAGAEVFEPDVPDGVDLSFEGMRAKAAQDEADRATGAAFRRLVERQGPVRIVIADNASGARRVKVVSMFLGGSTGGTADTLTEAVTAALGQP